MDLSEGGLALRAEALQRQRESLLASPQSFISAAMRQGTLPPGAAPPHLPFLPPTTQVPPRPGSGGSSSSGNGNRTPSHTSEPTTNHSQPWTFEEQFKQVRNMTRNFLLASCQTEPKETQLICVKI